ncbi:MAG: DUF4301 family protein [Nitrospirae bacterium]|nr:MAG: DUF4301 family protein [Nitrospirota bacterium]
MKAIHVLSEQDRDQIAAHGLSLEEVERQLTLFQQGTPFLTLKKPCTLGDGIRDLNGTDEAHLLQCFEQAAASGRLLKFVPASGAATRMFKSLFAAYTASSSAAASQPNGTAPLSPSEARDLQRFLQELPRFAFYEDLRSVMNAQGYDLEHLRTIGQYQPILASLLLPHGLNYAKLPKALVKFHRYPNRCRTPIEEHLVEAAAYIQDAHHTARVHFTVSPEHQSAVSHLLDEIQPHLQWTGVRYHVTCSIQKPSTDTIAVDMDNRPFRDRMGRLVFRPGGHGALLENLNDLRGDIVFIKNIDNVAPDHLKSETCRYKRLMAGLLLDLQARVFTYLRQLAAGDSTPALIEDIARFAQTELSLPLPQDWHSWSFAERHQLLFRQLNRPLRVCGMVKNTGDPGGGPFWVEQPDGSISLQIVESTQVNPHDPSQQDILRTAAYFNPVDMVCGVRDYRGEPFNLHQFCDPATAFITYKSHEGRELKALEHPGLWNGSMANWNTVFVEIPRSTFHPVKTVFDLLLPAHQSPNGL